MHSNLSAALFEMGEYLRCAEEIYECGVLLDQTESSSPLRAKLFPKLYIRHAKATLHAHALLGLFTRLNAAGSPDIVGLLESNSSGSKLVTTQGLRAADSNMKKDIMTWGHEFHERLHATRQYHFLAGVPRSEEVDDAMGQLETWSFSGHL